MLKRFVLTIVAAAFAASAAAQTKPAAPAKPDTREYVAAAKPEPVGLPTNIKIEVSITDQAGNNQPAKKVVTMIASDRQSANVRSSASVPVKSPGASNIPVVSYNYRNVTINVDARPVILASNPNKISVAFSLEYLPKTAGTQEEMEPGMTSWKESLSLILESGKPMVISQAADPTSDRKITVEVTATILK